tara:strand:- start:2636 stop:3004 length:369 start_codon:yes stop_codon:yes gene_type:complete
MKLRRKASGGRYKQPNQAKSHSRKGKARVVKLGERKTKVVRGMGGSKKIVSLSDNFASVVIKGKAKKVAIKNVLETPANRFLARQNVLVKGALIETEVGKARITNRPSQEGIVQAVILEEKE